PPMLPPPAEPSAPPTEPATTPTTPTPPAAPKPAPPTRIELPRDTYAPREPWRFVPSVSMSFAYDRLPGVAYGPRAGVAFLPPRFPEFRVSVGALLPREKTTGPDESGGRFWLVDASFELCPLEYRGTGVRVSGCVGQSIGRLTVEGIGFDENDEEPGLDLLLTLGVSSFLRVAGPLGVVLGVGGGFPLSRNLYSARNAEGERVEVWQRGYVVGSAEVGLGLEL
ncbi:MAG TPA: hypothetical protein VFZ53_17925, partial [Polyangiaceae bacterium]